jgi:hypothetical protein
MLKRLAVAPRRHLILAALLAAGFWFVLHGHAAEAQQNGVRRSPVIVAPAFPARPRIGGYSMTLSEIWGLPEMPPAPKDFGPHFDFPPESLNGPPLHDPYPN